MRSKILTSVAPDVKNDALLLCREVGAYLDDHKLDEAVTYSWCICCNRAFVLLRKLNNTPIYLLLRVYC